MNDIRLMQILRVTIANVCDLSNGYKASTDTLWEMHGELEQAVREEQKHLADLSTKIAEDLIEGRFIYHGTFQDPKERKRQVANRVYRTLFEN